MDSSSLIKSHCLVGSSHPHLGGEVEHPLMPKIKKPDTINPSMGRLEAEWTKGTLSECLFKAADFRPASPNRTLNWQRAQGQQKPPMEAVPNPSCSGGRFFLSSTNLSIIRLPQQLD